MDHPGSTYLVCPSSSCIGDSRGQALFSHDAIQRTGSKMMSLNSSRYISIQRHSDHIRDFEDMETTNMGVHPHIVDRLDSCLLFMLS